MFSAIKVMFEIIIKLLKMRFKQKKHIVNTHVYLY